MSIQVKPEGRTPQFEWTTLYAVASDQPNSRSSHNNHSPWGRGSFTSMRVGGCRKMRFHLFQACQSQDWGRGGKERTWV